MLSRNTGIHYQFFENHIKLCKDESIKINWYFLLDNKNIYIAINGIAYIFQINFKFLKINFEYIPKYKIDYLVSLRCNEDIHLLQF